MTKEKPDAKGFYKGWAEDGGKAQAVIDKADGATFHVRSPEQRERMAVAQRIRWNKIKKERQEKADAIAAAKAKGKRAPGRQR